MINNDPRSQQFLAALDILNQRLQETQDQITSGLRVAKPSDDPWSVVDIVNLRTQQGQADQTQKNLQTVKAQVDAADSALAAAIQALSNAVSVGTQGATSTYSADQRKQMAIQIQQIQAQIVSIAGTTVAGRYIFSGDDDSQASYQLNPDSVTGVDRLITPSSTNTIADVTGARFATGLTAQDIFDARNSDDSVAAGNVFAALNQLRVALEGNDQQGIRDATGLVKQSTDYVNGKLAFYGAVQNRIASALDYAQQSHDQSVAALSAKRDADAPSAILELTRLKAQLSAGMAAESQRPTQSLFDYLP